MKDQFEFKLTDKFGGYNSSADKTNLPAGILIRGSKNVYKTIRGTIATREGIKRRGSVDSTSAGVKASFEWDTNVGTRRNLKVSNNKLQVESDILTPGTLVWYDLLETSTLLNPAASLTRFVFDTWWDNAEKTDRLIMARGSNDIILSWSGGIAIVDSVTATTITKQGTSTWAELGFATQISGEKKIIIDGREFTYTGGEGTTTLTGVTASSGLVESLTSGMVAIQSVISNATDTTNFKIDFLKTHDNQVWVGSYSSRIVYKSADVTSGSVLGFVNLIDATDIVYGDPDFVVLDDLCKGIGVRDGKIILFAGTSQMTVVTPNQNVTFSYKYDATHTRFNFQKIDKINLPGLGAALGHEFIDNSSNYLVWLDQKNQLRALGSFSTIDSVVPTILSLPVQTELSEDDFTGGHLRVIGNTIHITAPNNARDWMYEVRERIDESGQIVSEKIWQPPQVRAVSRIAIVDGLLHGYSNVNPQLYQLEETNQWFDDHPSGEEIPYIPVARFSYQNHGRRQGRIEFDIAYYEGYMAEGFDLKGTVYLDYQGATGIRDLSLSDDEDTAAFFSGLDSPSLGESSPGDNPLGDGILEEANGQENVPKFRVMVNIPSPKNCFEYCLELYSVDADCRWELLAFGTNIKLASANAVDLRK